jgi:glycosyltransferase involved in cell wall biosynthesis
MSPRILVAVLGARLSPYPELIRTIERTWAGVEVRGVETVVYSGDSARKRIGRDLILPVPDDAANIGRKTIAFFEYALENCEFDVLFRTNSSSYVDLRNLQDHAGLRPEVRRLYSGFIGTTPHPFASGSGYFLGRQLMELVVEHQSAWDHSLADDAALARVLAGLGVEPLPEPRVEYTSVRQVADVDTSQFHFRCRTDSWRRLEDRRIMLAVHRAFCEQRRLPVPEDPAAARVLDVLVWRPLGSGHALSRPVRAHLRRSRPTNSLRRTLRPVARPLKRGLWRAQIERDARRARACRADLAVFHKFAPSPAGGGHQTLRAVLGELERRGARVEHNTISPSTRAVLFNSFNFDFDRLELLVRRADGVRMVHRVGAVTSLYRGVDDGTDARVASINRRLADATIAISHATIEMYLSIGVELVAPRVIYNGCDHRIFNPEGRVPFGRDRKIRLIGTSWSDNPRKGGPTYRWLEDRLDWDRYEFTFVGNASQPFERIRHLPPLPSHRLAEELRSHDIFLTATENDAYSNALVEALSCGLPALYLDSGGSAEAVKDAGFGFRDREEIPGLLERLVAEYEDRQAAIDLPSLEEIADRYLDALGLEEFVGVRTD